MVALAGHPFRPGGEPPEAEVARVRERLPVLPPAEASVLGNRELFGRLATTAMLPEMEQVCTEWRPDLVLREPCEYASAIVARGLGIHSAQVAISLSEGEAASITTAAPALEEHQRGLVQHLRASPYLTRFPGSLDPPVFPTTVRFREPVRHPSAHLPDWWGGSRAPLLYMTFGTVLGYMSIAPGICRTALQAVKGLGVRVLLTVGRRLDRASLGPIPPNVHVEAWVDQAVVLDQAEVVVCHGGSGTAFGAMTAGVPVVVVPLFADQFENARRIAEAGAGLAVHEAPQGAGAERRVIGQDAAPRIAQAIEEVLTDHSYRLHAARISMEIANAPMVDVVLESLLSTRS
jgi:UDP:flavonoid glycosyltransferase YjiC (YdhE family)